MSTIQEFENAPVGATAEGGKWVKARPTNRYYGEWVEVLAPSSLKDEGERMSNESMAGHSYSLDPSPAPATAREALALAWDLAYPIKEGQKVETGTQYIAKIAHGEFMTYRSLKPFDGVSRPGWAEARTLDPLPETEPDWLDAPAVFARCVYCSHEDHGLQITLHGPVSNGQNWECTECQTATGWSALRDVTPLYPKKDTGHDPLRHRAYSFHYDKPWGTRLGGDPA